MVLAPSLAVFLLQALVIPADATDVQEPVQSTAQSSPFEAVPDAPKSLPERSFGPAIVAIEFQGAKWVQPSVLRAMIASRVGAPYDAETLRRDTQALLRTGRFSDVVRETVESRSGPIVRFVLAERPVIQSVEYRGNNLVRVPEILARLELRKINIRPETLFHVEELERAGAVVRELLSEKAGQNFSVSSTVEPIWPSTGVQEWPPSDVKIVFRAEKRQ